MIIIIISFIIVIQLKKSNNIYAKTSANQLFLYYKVLLVAVPLAVNIYRECKKFRVYLMKYIIKLNFDAVAKNRFRWWTCRKQGIDKC